MAQAAKDLVKIKDEVASLNVMLKELNEKFEAGSAEEKELKEKAETMERRLNAASKLIAGLGSERTRWTVRALRWPPFTPCALAVRMAPPCAPARAQPAYGNRPTWMIYIWWFYMAGGHGAAQLVACVAGG